MINEDWQKIFDHYDIVITSFTYVIQFQLQLADRLAIDNAFASVLSEWGNS